MQTRAIDHVITVIPARNEARSIGRCLRSVNVARAGIPEPITTSVVVVDAGRDRTGAIATADLDPACDLLLHTENESAGMSRRTGVAAALRRTPVDLTRIWVCSTDADSTVPSDWYRVHLDAADAGHIAISGVVELDDAADPFLLAQFRSTYHTHPDGTHPHVHAANLGFRADAYVAAGGWAPLASGEDHDLWGRLTALGASLASARLSVTTASRLIGRAPAGFAADLTALLATEPAA